MSMATANPTAGGPVGGGMMMMSNGSPAMGAVTGLDQLKTSLNLYIYDYLLKNGHYDIARSASQDSRFDFPTGPKASPGRRKDNDMNGDIGDGMGMDMNPKDDAPDDLPRPKGWDGTTPHGFLFEWFSIFNDLFQAHRNQAGAKNAATQYLSHEKSNQRLRESLQNQNINRPAMNPAMLQQMRAGMMNGKMQNQMTPQAAQMLQHQKRQQMQMQQQMARAEQGDGEMNGVRPGTPADGDATGSPSKRPRIDNGQAFPQGMMPNGRPAGVPGGPNQGMMIQSGFQPGMGQQFRQNGAMPPKGMQAGMPNGMMTMANAGSPMMGAGMNQFADGMQMDMYNRQNMPGGQPMQTGGGAQSGNHALQDYQMQLMLLEQQNKKRLMMARQEQHENNPGATGMPGINMPSGMSPSGSRTGNSPNPADMAGRSPAAMSAFNMQGNDFNAGMFMNKDQPMMGVGPQGMRPPTSNMQQGGRPTQFQGGQPMQQQGSQTGQQMGTPGQRNDMPPPQAPAGGNSAQRNSGNSPPTQNQPPTPSQTSKPNPKNKKNAAKDDNKKQRPTKKGSMATTQGSDDNPPATPTPSTPITPNNPGMNAAAKAQPGMQPSNQGQQNNLMNQQMQQNDMNNFNFGTDSTSTGTEPFNLDFSTLENAEVLENFDFDSFLNTSADDTFNFTNDIELSGDFGMGQGD
ncbi:hypothetical protein LTR05_003223 [Lithohypha guttulata]|uniref:LisH domain-containing protein n=1 Tax=Lithohypha guttulata TaxID=1690604 RepID=A0AAN7T6A7_9EURO|nr:hypothetical protein LTR05_003223 [Lithohypha guttulata]